MDACPREKTWVSTTKSLAADIPPHVLWFGLAGTLPYMGTSVTAVFLAREASRAASGLTTLTGLDLDSAMAALHTVEHVQITYGAIILSFLGALHWGMEFAKYGGEIGIQRLAIGVVPVLIAWPTTFLTHGVALAPVWYSTYRFYLSIIVGFSIIGTLAGTSYYGVGSGAVSPAGEIDVTTAKLSSMKRLDKVASKNHRSVSGKLTGVVGGDVETEDLGPDGDAFVKFVHKTKTDEEAEEEEEAHQELASKQDTKEIDQAATTPEGFKTEIKGRTDVRDGLQDKGHSAAPADDDSGRAGR
ncbi:hypothetical protein QFC21_004204 [Naganishia friedmannii]|uniref:Uncharacterized protein n=1 Tax=Naganishia friedmannii TaxID=89922 RepID=A0ACC2VIV3_9TREE|nr:hypothetical protein QFC21_004204 [Naganishia friedmannii]